MDPIQARYFGARWPSPPKLNMAIKHATTKAPGQRVFAVADWNADHQITNDLDISPYNFTAVNGTFTGDITGNFNITASPADDHSASGIKITLIAAQTTNFGDVCYIAATGKATLVDADAVATCKGIVMCADASISADAEGNFLLIGIARDDTWAWTVGGFVYSSLTGTTGNTITQSAPSGGNDVVQVLGVATHADRIFFNPQLVLVEVNEI